MPPPQAWLHDPHPPVYQEAVDGHASVLHDREVEGLVPAPSVLHSLSATEEPSRVQVTERDCVPPSQVSCGWRGTVIVWMAQ